MRLSQIAASFLLLPLAACAAQGPFPSLAPRAVERELAALDAAQPAPAVLPDDPAVAARIGALLADARRGQSEFEAASDAASQRARSAGPAGSDAWVAAQEALSRLEAARGLTAVALTELDSFALERVQASPALSAADQARIEAAIAEVQAMAAAQQQRIDRIRATLTPT